METKRNAYEQLKFVNIIRNKVGAKIFVNETKNIGAVKKAVKTRMYGKIVGKD